MTESVRDRWVSIGMSVLLHGTLIALLAIGVWRFRHPAPAPTLPIDATVVDASTLKGAGTASRPAPKPKAAPAQAPLAPPSEGPPLPTPDEEAIREQAAKAEAQHEAEAQKELLARQQAKAQEEAQRQAQEAAAAQAKKEADAQAAAQAQKVAEAQKKAEAKKAAKLAAEKKLAQQRELAQEKKLAEEKKLAAQRAAAARAARIAELRQSLQEDAQATAASGALASWQSEITSRIQNAWIKPPTARAGIECVLNVSLVPGGTVTGVSIGQCNGDDAVRQSIQTAVYNASPLPAPPNGIPFPSQLIIDFKPSN
ncbi:MAG TPA: cell envelope integrity protein TolA [Gammaproteobacteria bacterium]|nr:cell envelope integrity protein TolA [Gammaproteobacteria bacterium]